VLGSDDSIESHLPRHLRGRRGLVDVQVARAIASGSAAAVEWLVKHGVAFTADPQGPLGLHLTREGGHAVRRIAHSRRRHRKAIHDALLAAARSHPNIRLCERFMAIDLITSRQLARSQEPQCFGVYALDIERQRVETPARRRRGAGHGGAAKV